jgi:hypothetical protein
MNHALPPLPPDHRLGRKDVCWYLKWSRSTLWRRERQGLRFVDGAIPLRQLQAWLDEHESEFPAERPSEPLRECTLLSIIEEPNRWRACDLFAYGFPYAAACPPL